MKLVRRTFVLLITVILNKVICFAQIDPTCEIMNSFCEETVVMNKLHTKCIRFVHNLVIIFKEYKQMHDLALKFVYEKDENEKYSNKDELFAKYPAYKQEYEKLFTDYSQKWANLMITCRNTEENIKEYSTQSQHIYAVCIYFLRLIYFNFDVCNNIFLGGLYYDIPNQDGLFWNRENFAIFSLLSDEKQTRKVKMVLNENRFETLLKLINWVFDYYKSNVNELDVKNCSQLIVEGDKSKKVYEGVRKDVMEFYKKNAIKHEEPEMTKILEKIENNLGLATNYFSHFLVSHLFQAFKKEGKLFVNDIPWKHFYFIRREINDVLSLFLNTKIKDDESYVMASTDLNEYDYKVVKISFESVLVYDFFATLVEPYIYRAIWGCEYK